VNAPAVALVAEIRTHLLRFESIVSRVVAAHVRLRSAFPEAATDDRRVGFALRRGLERLLMNEMSHVDAAEHDLAKIVGFARTIVLPGGIVGAVITLVLGFVVARRISRPIAALERSAKTIAGGDVGQSVAVRAAGEIGALARAFEEMRVGIVAARENLRRETEERKDAEARVARSEREIAQAREIERAYEKLKETQAQLVQAAKLATLGQIAGTIAHEINNPLTAVVTFSALMKEDATSGVLPTRETVAKHQDYLDRIERAAARCKAVIEGVLSFSRKAPNEFADVALAAVVRDATALVERQIKVQGTALSVDVADGLAVRGDANQLSQAVLNLLVNAAQALGRGGAIRVRATADKGATVLLVSDTGPGIPEELRATLFEPFVTTKPAGQGTGLGLAVTRTIMEAHGGRIDVESGMGTGTTFRLVFPNLREGEG
jgi:two-component system NtrC family sensor kinase